MTPAERLNYHKLGRQLDRIHNQAIRMTIPDYPKHHGKVPPERREHYKNQREKQMADEPDKHPSKSKGGEIKKTGIYKLHKGEIVVPANRVESINKSLKKDNKKPLKK
jgi:hypothetical protein